MYSVFALIIFLIIKNSAAAVIHLEDVKLNANGAPTVTQSSDISVSSTTESVHVETKNTEAKEIGANENSTPITNHPVTANKRAKKGPTNGKINTQHDSLAVKPEKLNKDEKTKPHFTISILKDPTMSYTTTTSTTEAPVKKIADNIIETRRMSGHNVYVPISEDILPKYDEDTFGKGIVRSGLSLIDLKGNILRIRL
uniref:Uncharacterized protein n=1 Tax=Heliothis virescens TaxID=7102 RepID=A0A2A4IU89_HELVI